MKNLNNKNVLVGITGSIAAYKAAELVSKLTNAGANVKVIMTKASTSFITENTLECISKNKVLLDESENDESFLHLDVDLYQSYKDCLEFFYPKLLKGGIVTFDEYTVDYELKKKKGWSFSGAKTAIDEFVEKNNLKLKHHSTGFKYIVK